MSEYLSLIEKIQRRLVEDDLASDEVGRELVSPEDGQYYYPLSESEIKFYVELLEDAHELVLSKDEDLLQKFNRVAKISGACTRDG